MVTRSPSVSQGQYGLMATVWLLLIAMFLAIFAATETPAPEARAPVSPLDVLAVRAARGEAPRVSAPVPVVFFEDASAALTDAGRDWLARFAQDAPLVRPGERLRLEILPPSAAHDLTAARVASVVALLGALGADMRRVEVGTFEADGSARVRLAGEGA